jgi:uncharacterized protein (TIGR02271 family)
MTEPTPDDDVRIALVEEVLNIDKKVVETGRVQVRTFVDDEQVLLSEALRREIVDVERIAVGQPVDVAPKVREDGEYLIVPILEERLVVTKQLFLVEELRLRRTTIVVPVDVAASRRVMRAEVERTTAAEQSGET